MQFEEAAQSVAYSLLPILLAGNTSLIAVATIFRDRIRYVDLMRMYCHAWQSFLENINVPRSSVFGVHYENWEAFVRRSIALKAFYTLLCFMLQYVQHMANWQTWRDHWTLYYLCCVEAHFIAYRQWSSICQKVWLIKPHLIWCIESQITWITNSTSLYCFVKSTSKWVLLNNMNPFVFPEVCRRNASAKKHSRLRPILEWKAGLSNVLACVSNSHYPVPSQGRQL